MPVLKSVGPDAPVYEENQDALDRWWFAREVYDLTTRAPAEWSLRIGIHGPWGSGKSSILGFIRTLSMAEGNIPVEFNPWGCSSEEMMWKSFLSSVLSAFHEAGIKVEGEGSIRAKSWMSDKLNSAATLLDGEAYAGSTAKVVRAITAERLQVGLSDLTRLRNAAAPRKIIVLVDDVDRVEPHLLPNLLFALKEILGVHGVAFIMALDPEVVGRALAAHHPGWGDGLRYLEKIIDFPKWLPEPSLEGLWAIAERDINAYASFIDKESFRSLFDLCPTNPRALRHYIRHLWALEREVSRHDPDEINWKALLLVQQIKSTWPSLAREVLGNDALLQQLTVMRYFSARRNSDGNEETQSTVREICRKCGVPLGELARAEAVILALGERTGLLAKQQIEYAAGLLERPHAVTWKEYRALLASENAANSNTLLEWIEHQATARGVGSNRVIHELFEASMLSWNKHLEAAADQRTEDAVDSEVAKASANLALLENLALGLGAFSGSLAPLSATDLARLTLQVAKWVPWTNVKRYLPLREYERNFLERVLACPGYDKVALYRVLVPTIEGIGIEFLQNPLGRSLVQQIVVRLEPEVGLYVVTFLRRPSGISELWTNSQQDFRQLLLRPDSSVYVDPSVRQALDDVASESARNENVHLNFVDMLLRFGWLLEEDLSHPERKQLLQLLAQRDIDVVAWTAATSRRIQARMQNSFRKVRKILIKETGHSLPLPTWWPIGEDEDSVSDTGDGADCDTEEEPGNGD